LRRARERNQRAGLVDFFRAIRDEPGGGFFRGVAIACIFVYAATSARFVGMLLRRARASGWNLGLEGPGKTPNPNSCLLRPVWFCSAAWSEPRTALLHEPKRVEAHRGRPRLHVLKGASLRLAFRRSYIAASTLKMSSHAAKRRSGLARCGRGAARICAALRGVLLAASLGTGFFSAIARTQQVEHSAPVVVQPGAPGEPSRALPPSTKGTLPPRSPADVEFMQGMIMHHSQAVLMTALLASHTENQELRSLGARISSSQSDEIKFMRRWLAVRGEPLSMPAPATPKMDMSKMGMPDKAMALMPGMLTPAQMEALRKAKGAEFDRLFLTGMIQHHNGALIMVKDLFDTAGAGQDADLFNFATDADNTQRAEIRIMQGMLEKKSSEEKR
jgi:uncharacterized protein (DUF305 family)